MRVYKGIFFNILNTRSKLIICTSLCVYNRTLGWAHSVATRQMQRSNYEGLIQLNKVYKVYVKVRLTLKM